MPIERLKPGSFIDEERLASLRELAPEAFADGSVNWATLKGALEGLLEEEGEEAEHFGLYWPGKREARRLASRPSSGSLQPCPGEGVDEATTSNIFIEGENLEVLKLLRGSYAGRVKMIYIDPPYNTGNDFVYDDDFTEPLKDYLKRTGQIDGEGRPLTTNKKSDGRFHSKWLSMMYPRLRLARELLRDDGVIFVSIDDNEVHHLRMLMNEVFGEENFVAVFIWEKRTNRENRKTVSSRHDYIICYLKNYQEKPIHQQPMSPKALANYKNPDNDPNDAWKSDPATAQAGHGTKTQFYTLVAPNGTKHELESGRCWLYTKDVMQKEIEEGHIWFGRDGNGVPRIKTYLNEKVRGLTPETIWFAEDVATNEIAKNQLKEMFDGVAVFETPKPIDLIQVELQICVTEGIILDFFSGSATTAHAVLDLNKEDGGKRQFILVQMPEKTPANSEAAKAGYANIAEIGKERIRRVIARIKAEKAGDLATGEEALDLGFKVYKLAQSNFKPWEDYHGEDLAKLDELFDEAVTPLLPSWKSVEDGLFMEILLVEGYPLHSKVKERPEFGANRVREVSSDFHEKRLLVCLDDRLQEVTVRDLRLAENEVFVCLDQAVGDELKSSLADKGLIKTI